jgi:hypothetical protein
VQCTSNVQTASSADQAQLLRCSLVIVRALRCEAAWLQLHGWTASTEVVAGFVGLPHWSATLVLPLRSCGGKTGSTWPAARVPWVIPRSHRQWDISRCTLQPDESQALVLNAPCDRTADNSLKIKVAGGSAPGLSLDALRQQMEQAGVYPYVTIV